MGNERFWGSVSTLCTLLVRMLTPLRGVRIILSMLKWHMHPGRVCIPLGRVRKVIWFGWGFWALVRVWACSKSFLELTIQN